VATIRFDREGRIYLGTLAGLVIGNPKSGSRYEFQRVFAGPVIGLEIEPDGSGWFGNQRELYRWKGRADPVSARMALPPSAWRKSHTELVRK
jgi:hypothetical protein